MPRQNRVTPFGELIATEARGTLMGNRGCLHDSARHIRRPFVSRRWIICVLEFRGRHRALMTPGRYTELFFLDEATALAAGHRPCAECQRARYRLFRETWAAANPGLPSGSADEIDGVLHAERVDGERRKRTYLAPVSELPPGVLVANTEGVPFLVREERLVLWEPGGYGRSIPKRSGDMVQVLTPKSVVRAIAQGYPVIVHPSAGTTGEGHTVSP
jgi:hypothetical protein